MRWVIVGLGGIGNKLLPDLCEQLNYDTKEEYTIVLVDGDKYEDKNRRRQRFGVPLLFKYSEVLQKVLQEGESAGILQNEVVTQVFNPGIEVAKDWASGLGNKAEVMARQFSAEFPNLF